MKTLKIKITLLSISILIFTMTLLTGYSFYSSNKYFVAPLIESEAIYKNEDKVNTENNSQTEQLVEIAASCNPAESQKDFVTTQIVFMILITGVGAILIYTVVAKSLKPLNTLNEAVKEIDEISLNKQIELPSCNDEVYYLTKSFNTMLCRLKSSFEIQRNFSYNAAHELKTPLTVIKSSIDVLELDENPTIDDYKENVSIVKESTNELIQIVEQLLSLSLTEKIDTQKVNLEQIILHCVEDYHKEIKKKNINVLTNLCKVEMNSNLILLKSIISNIVSNAIKYNKQNGNLTIVTIKENNDVVIKISDNGIGIKKENLPHIFEAFYRVDLSRSKQIKGNGLGLSIAKVSIEKLGGNINIGSEINKGTEVIIKLPVS